MKRWHLVVAALAVVAVGTAYVKASSPAFALSPSGGWQGRNDVLEVMISPAGVSSVKLEPAVFFSLKTRQIERAQAPGDGLAPAGDLVSVESVDGVAHLKRFDGVVESWQVAAHSVEQRWAFAQAPAGEGDLSVEVELSGATVREQTAQGLMLVLEPSQARVRYSHATFVDAKGVKTAIEVASTHHGTRLVMKVPEAVLTRTTWPAVLDPTLTVEQPLAPTLTQKGEAVRGQQNPAAASLGNKMLVAWEDERYEADRPAVFAAWFDKTNFALSSRFLLAADAYDPAIAAAGSKFLISWTQRTSDDTNIGAAWVDGATGVVDSRMSVSALLTSEYSSTVACDNGSTPTCFIAYLTDQGGSGAINAARLTLGSTAPTTGQVVAQNSTIQYPALAWNGSRFVLVWQDLRQGSSTVDLAGISFVGTSLPASAAGALVLAGPTPAGGRYLARLTPGPANETLLMWQQFGPTYYATRLSGVAGLTPFDTPFQPWPAADGINEQASGFYDSNAYQLFAYSSTNSLIERRTLPNGPTGGVTQSYTVALSGYRGSVTIIGRSSGSSMSAITTTGIENDLLLTFFDGVVPGTMVLEQSSPALELPAVGANTATGEALVAYQEFSDGGYDLGFTVLMSDGGVGPSALWAQPGMQLAPSVASRAGVSTVAWLTTGSGRCGRAARATLVNHDTASPGAILNLVNSDVCASSEVVTAADRTLVYIPVFGGALQVAAIGFDGGFDGGTVRMLTTNATAVAAVAGPNNRILLAVGQSGTSAGLALQLGDLSGDASVPLTVSGATLPSGARDEIAVDSDGTQYLVAWVDVANLATSGNDVLAARVNASGTLIDANPVTLDQSQANTTRISLSWNGRHHVLAMENESADAGRVIDIKWFNSALGPLYSRRIGGAEVVKQPALASLGSGNTLLAFTRSIESPSVAANRVFTTQLQVGDGDTCTNSTECFSGHCISGVCCNSGCSGVCQTCLASQGASKDGTCSPKPVTVECRASGGACDLAEKCDGVNPGCPADALAPATTTCRPATDGCDVAENCTGASITCPVDLIAPANMVCNSTAAPCALPGSCDGLSKVCPAVGVRAANTQCRAAEGPCDVSEFCDGLTQACPVDTFVANTAVCREAAGDCDVAEQCTGASANCPVDLFKTDNEVCRAEASSCDAAERCTGSSANCPPNSVRPSTFICRTKAGVCDLEETCDGTSSECPTDAVNHQLVCRAAVSSCDAAEACNGSSKDCPTDVLVFDGQSCGEAGLCEAGVCREGIGERPKSRYGFGCGGCAGAGGGLEPWGFFLALAWLSWQTGRRWSAEPRLPRAESRGSGWGSTSLALNGVQILRRALRRAGSRLAGYIALVTAVACVTASSTAIAAERQRAAFIGIARGAGVSEETTRSVTEYVQTQLNNAGLYDVTGPSDIANLLGLERQRQLLGCGESTCGVELAGALNADRIISGDLSRIDDTFLLNLSLQDARNGKALGRGARKVDGKLAQLLDEVQLLVLEVLTQEPDKRAQLIEPVRFGGLSVGLRADGDVFALGIAPGVSAEYAWRWGGIALTLIPKATPGARLEGRFYPIVAGRFRPFVSGGFTAFSTGLGIRGAAGVAIAVGHFLIGVDAGYEYYAVDFVPALNLSPHAILVGLSLSWAFSG